MFNQIARMIQQALRPYDDQFAQLIGRVEELERRVRNQIRPGKVIDIDPANALVKVAYGGGCESPWIKWFAPAAGKIREYRCPSVGEQCALINYGGGDNSTQAWALCGIWSDEFAAPGDAEHLHIIDWGGGMKLTVDTDAKTVEWSAENGVTFNTKKLIGTGSVEDAVRTMQGDRDIFNAHTNGSKTTLPSPSM